MRMAPQRPVCLNACSLIGRTVWKGLRGIALLEDVCHWGQALGFQKPMQFPVSSLPLVYGTKFKLSATVPMPCLPAPMVFTMMVIDSETISHQ